MSKKIIALLITALLIVSVFGGCSSKPNDNVASNSVSSDTPEVESSVNEEKPEEQGTPDISEPVTLKWLLRISEQPDSDTVLESVNERLEEDINASLDIEFIEAAAYGEKTKLKFAAGEEFDLLWLNAGTFPQFLAQKALIPMDEYFEVYAPSLHEVIPENFWPATQIKGETMAVTNYQICARQFLMRIPKTKIEEYEFDVSTVKELKDLTAFYEKAHANEPDDVQVATPLSFTSIDLVPFLGYEVLGDFRVPGAIHITGDHTKVVNQFESKEFKDTMLLAREWNEKGYIDPDLQLGQNIEDLTKNEKQLSLPGTYSPHIYSETITRYGFEPEMIRFGNPYVSTNNIQGTMTGLSYTSKNPERAMMFLELMNTDAEIYNTILYGVEDIHYTKDSEGKVEVTPEAGYVTNVPWMLGNTLLAYPTPEIAENAAEETDKLNRESTPSPILGFYFDPEPVKTELASCTTIVEKHDAIFSSGSYEDVEGMIETMNEELRAAGMDAVIEEKQAQLDAWLAENK